MLIDHNLKGLELRKLERTMRLVITKHLCQGVGATVAVEWNRIAVFFAGTATIDIN